MAERLEPKSVRDLRLMYETTNKIDGNVEYHPWPHEWAEGCKLNTQLRVVPQCWWEERVTVIVQTEYATNVRSNGAGMSYTPKRECHWQKDYSFAEFRESPFWDMTLDAWCGSWRTKCDTSLMDEHEACDDETKWWVWAHYYRHERDWLNNWRKSGEIGTVNFFVDKDGNVDLDCNGEDVFDGYFEDMCRAIVEHERLTENMKHLKEHGVDFDSGTLRIRLWEE